MRDAVKEAVKNLIDQPSVHWDSDKLNWKGLTDTGATFNVPDDTASPEDNERAAILSVIKIEDGSIGVETTRGNFTFPMGSL